MILFLFFLCVIVVKFIVIIIIVCMLIVGLLVSVYMLWFQVNFDCFVVVDFVIVIVVIFFVLCLCSDVVVCNDFGDVIILMRRWILVGSGIFEVSLW